MRQTIYVSGYPKSGTTWLTRLLGDILNSPTGGCMPELDHTEVATEGQDRPGSYIVRKGHFVLIDNDTGPIVPSPHRLAWRQLTNERIVFIVRDPRDICVSGAYHWNTTPELFLDRMIRGDIAKCGRWDEYVSEWVYYNHDICSVVLYEKLLDDSNLTLRYTMRYIGYSLSSYTEAIQRQSFQAKQSQIGSNEQELKRNNLRKGISGDWHNHFTQEMNDKIWSEFGWVMEGLGYECN